MDRGTSQARKTVRDVLREPALPVHVAPFRAWCDTLIAQVQETNTLAAIQGGKVILLDRFMQLHSDAPKSERMKLGTMETPTLWSVFSSTYAVLRDMELRAVPIFSPREAAIEQAPLEVWIGERE